MMQARTCPNCQFKYSPQRYFSKMLFRSLGDAWPCPDCGTELRFHRRQRLFIALSFGCWLMLLLLLKNGLGLTGVDNLWLLPLLLLGLVFYLFDDFELAA